MRLRVNPRQRAVHALFKTYLDVVHVARADEAKLFAGSPAATGAAAAAPAPSASLDGAAGASQGLGASQPAATQPAATQAGGAYGATDANVTREELLAKERKFRVRAHFAPAGGAAHYCTLLHTADCCLVSN